jgi:hypothetical protein
MALCVVATPETNCVVIASVVKVAGICDAPKRISMR